MNELDILKKLIIKEEETETLPQGFEEDPMGFILKKYPGLNNVMEYMMTKEFREFVDAIFVVAPKPTTFKVLLHNGQYFFLQFMGDTYQATVQGKNYYLKSIGEKERCMLAIARLLRYGTPLKTKGPEGGETGTGGEEGAIGGETTPTETGGEEAGGEEGGEALEEDKFIVKTLLEDAVPLNEADTTKATLFESALVYAWYKINNFQDSEIPEENLEPENLSKVKKDKKMLAAAIKAVKNLGLSGGKYAKHTGRLGAISELTPFWKKYEATDTTPKTDVILGGKRISVKVGPSQLMSGGKEESTATFYATLKRAPWLAKSDEVKRVKALFSGFVKGYTDSGTVKANLQSKKNKILNDADKVHKEMMAALEELFTKSDIFAREFAKEAMSGAHKFETEEAIADYVLSADSGSYENAILHRINDDAYALKVARQVNITVRFKSTQRKLKGEKTGSYRFWSVVALIFNPSSVKEGVLDSVSGFVKGAKDYITSGIRSAIDYFQSGLDKLLNFVVDKEDVDVDVKNTNKVDFS